MNPSEHNHRLANGHEPRANEHFTGLDSNGDIDPSVYNGKTSGYVDEAVSNKVPMSDIDVEGPREFTSPANDAAVLNNASKKNVRTPRLTVKIKNKTKLINTQIYEEMKVDPEFFEFNYKKISIFIKKVKY